MNFVLLFIVSYVISFVFVLGLAIYEYQTSHYMSEDCEIILLFSILPVFNSFIVLFVIIKSIFVGINELIFKLRKIDKSN